MERGSSQYDTSAHYAQAATAFGHHDVAFLGSPPAPSEPAIHQEIDAGVTRPQGSVNVANVLRLLEYQHYRCALTGRLLTPDTASLDHIVPVRCGGEHLVQNTQVLHKDVNRAKTTMTNDEFIQLCHDVVMYTKLTSTKSDFF